MAKLNGMQRIAIAILLQLTFSSFCLSASTTARKSNADLVDPSIGVKGKGEGSTVIGPTLPHGSIHPSPDTKEGGEAGYRVDRPIRGFSQLHVSGTGWGTYGNLLLSPQIGLDVSESGHDSEKTAESAKSYAYKVTLRRYGIRAEVAPALHTAMYRFTFPTGDQSHLLLDLGQQIPGQLGTQPGDGSVTDSKIVLDKAHHSFSGSSKYTGGFGGGSYTVYFYGELSQIPAGAGTFRNLAIGNAVSEQSSKAGDRVGGWWRFAAVPSRPVLVKIGISFRDIPTARRYVSAELPTWSYEAVRDHAHQAWNKELGRIQVEGGDDTQRTLFYTALYHAGIMPRDRTGEFERFPADAPMWDDFYATWDIWRTDFPLMLWLRPDMVRGAIASFEERLRVDGQVRDVFVAGFGGPGRNFVEKSGILQTGVMPDQGGNDVDNVIADAYAKGLRGVDWEKAYAVLKHNADYERQGLVPESTEDYRKQGWIRGGANSVSNTLEYAYNDFAIAEVAEGLGQADDAKKYRARSQQWQQLFNASIESDGYKGFVMPKTASGEWIAFPPKQYPGSWKDYFGEASSWTYTLFTPHQVERLVELIGGPEIFAARLDHANQADLIDFFNEPGFLAPTLFHYAGRPDLSQKWTRRFVQGRYSLKGYPGDDDSGAMSAYYVWVSMGLFPMAGQDLYLLNTPLFDRITVSRPEEGRLTIIRKGTGEYVAGVRLNGRPLDRAWVKENDLGRNAELIFSMSSTPTKWGANNLPPTDATPAGGSEVK